VIARSGAEPVVEIGLPWSGGRQLRFPAAKPGDQLEMEAPVPAGKWNLTAGLTRGPGYGDYEILVNDAPAGSFQGFAAKTEVRDGVRLSSLAGPGRKVKLRFRCTGKAPQATGFALGLDYVGWRRMLVEDALEGESAELVEVKDGTITDQLLGARFSGGNHLWFHPAKVGAAFTWLLDVPEDGRYELSVYFTKSWDYARVRVSLAGQELGTFDTYAPEVTWGGKTSLGTHPLTKGKARLTFEVVGKSERSKGILVGVDCVTLQRVR